MNRFRLFGGSRLFLPTARLPRWRRQARAHAGIVLHARKSRDDYGQYTDYYSSEEARELSQIMPDPNNLFDDSLPAPTDLGLYAAAAASPASAAAAASLFGGDLHSSLDDSLYSDAYNEEFNSFRDPGPDAGPWFSQQSPINSGLSLDQDIEVLSDEAKAYRQWELQKALDKALELSSYQLTHTVNRYMVSVEHSQLMEEIEQEDAHRGLDASPLAATTLPPWIRAVYRLQEDFDALNEQQAWNEEQASLENMQQYEQQIEDEAYRAVELLQKMGDVNWEAQSNRELEVMGADDVSEAASRSALDDLMRGAALPAAGGSSLAVWGGGAAGAAGAAGEPSGDVLGELLPGAEGLFPEALAPELEAELAAAAEGFWDSSYVDPLTTLPDLLLSGGGAAARQPGEAAASGGGSGVILAGSGGGGGVQLTPRQALEDMDAEFDRRAAAWEGGASDDDEGAALGALGLGGLEPAGGAIWGGGAGPFGGGAGGFAGEVGRYGMQYGAGAGAFGGGELDEELGPWWGVDEEVASGSEEELGPGMGMGVGMGLSDDDDFLLGPYGGMGLLEGEGELEEGGLGVVGGALGALGSSSDEDDDPNFSRSDLFQLRQAEAELRERRRRGGGGGAGGLPPSFPDDL